jgi:hypothetical protein
MAKSLAEALQEEEEARSRGLAYNPGGVAYSPNKSFTEEEEED